VQVDLVWVQFEDNCRNAEPPGPIRSVRDRQCSAHPCDVHL